MATMNQPFAMMQKAVSHHQKGQIPEAEKSYLKVLELDPRHIDALRLLGSLYIQWNKIESAIWCFEKALRIKPDHPELLNNLGVALYGQGKRSDALAHYQRAVKIAPDYGDALDNLGNLFYESGKLDDAIACLERSVRLNPNHPRAHAILGHAFRMQKKTEQAIIHYRRVLDLRPDDIDILTDLGNLLRETGQSEEACKFYRRLAELKPNDAKIQLNLGTIFHDMGQLAEALERFDEALRLRPGATDIMVNRAGLLMELDRPEEARAGYEQCLSVDPDLQDAKWGKSLALLMSGAYAEGWALYESRFAYASMRKAIPSQAARWDGGSLEGKRLLIWGEQGFGDVLQFIRYAALCKARGGAITVLCRKPLMRLLKNCSFIDEIITSASESHFDFQIPVMSLPHIFGTTLETIPHDVPYLHVSEETRRKWAPRFADTKDFKVGLVWAGNPRKIHIDAHVTDRQRSMTLALMEPLFHVDRCRFYSLQKDDASGGPEAGGRHARLIDYMDDVEDFMDTAALIEHLDLVISVDTSVVHLAGGLGKPVWVLSRFGGCWRWLRNQETNPWYPTARVFGQSAPGNWIGCIDKIVQALNETATR